jgi:Sap, sulfolipid-1-addressing protein
VGRAFTFALTAALNPTLLTAVTVMLTLSRPKRLLTGYLAGAMVTSLICGLLLVFSLDGSSAANTAKNTINPMLDLVLGGLILLIAFIVGTGRDKGGERAARASARKPKANRRRAGGASSAKARRGTHS